MKKRLFIILSIISVIIEYTLIFCFFKFILNKSFIISTLMMLIILLIMMIFVSYANVVLKKTSIEDKNRPCESELLSIIDNANKLYNKEFKLHYITAAQPNPAWCVGNHIYINNSCSVNPVFLPGVVAHELGHAMSGLTDYTSIPSLKISTFISRVFNLTIIAFATSRKKVLHALAYILFVPYIIVNLNNLIFTYPLLRDDEHTANSIAVKLGYGDSLRCYYGFISLEEYNVLFRKSDFMHPNVDSMIERMNVELKIDSKYLNYYYVGSILIYAKISTKTIVLPDFITELSANSLYNENLKKVSSEYVLKVSPLAFRTNLELEEINLPNVKIFPISCLKNLYKLKKININDVDILKQIYQHYPNSLFSAKIYKILLEKGLIDNN